MIRPLTKTDFPKVEKLIRDTILAINIKDYSEGIINSMITIDPFRPRDTYHEREYFVYDTTDIYGIIGIKDNEVKTFFVDAKSGGKGIWTTLLSYATELIAKNGNTISCVYSSVSARSFYEKNGYITIREDFSKIGEETMLRYYLEKKL